MVTCSRKGLRSKESLRWEIRILLVTTGDNVVELIMADNHPTGNHPENVVEWSRIVKEEANQVAEMQSF